MLKHVISKNAPKEAKSAVPENSNRLVLNIPKKPSSSGTALNALSFVVRSYAQDMVTTVEQGAKSVAPAEEISRVTAPIRNLQSFTFDKEQLCSIPVYQDEVAHDITNSMAFMLELLGPTCNSQEYISLLQSNIQRVATFRDITVEMSEIRRSEEHIARLRVCDETRKKHGDIAELVILRAFAQFQIISEIESKARTNQSSSIIGVGALCNIAQAFLTSLACTTTSASEFPIPHPINDVVKGTSAVARMYGTGVVGLRNELPRPAVYSHYRSVHNRPEHEMRFSDSTTFKKLPLATAAAILGVTPSDSFLKSAGARTGDQSYYDICQWVTEKASVLELYYLQWVIETLNRATWYVNNTEVGAATPSPLILQAAMYTCYPAFEPAGYDTNNLANDIAIALSTLAHSALRYLLVLHRRFGTENPEGYVREYQDGRVMSLFDYTDSPHTRVGHTIQPIIRYTGYSPQDPYGLLMLVDAGSTPTSMAYSEDARQYSDSQHVASRGNYLLGLSCVGGLFEQRVPMHSGEATQHRIHTLLINWLSAMPRATRYLSMVSSVQRQSYSGLGAKACFLSDRAALEDHFRWQVGITPMYHDIMRMGLQSLCLRQTSKCTLSEDIRIASGLPKEIFVLGVLDSVPLTIPLLVGLDKNLFPCVYTPTHKDTQRFLLTSYPAMNSITGKPLSTENDFLSHAGSPLRRSLLNPGSQSFAETLRNMLTLVVRSPSTDDMGDVAYQCKYIDYVDFNEHFRGVCEDAPKDHNTFVRLAFGPDLDEGHRDYWKYWRAVSSPDMLTSVISGIGVSSPTA